MNDNLFQEGETIYRAKFGKSPSPNVKKGQINRITRGYAPYTSIGGYCPSKPKYHDGAGWARTEEQAIEFALTGLRNRKESLTRQLASIEETLSRFEASK